MITLRRGGDEQNGTASRQYLRPSLGDFARVEFCEWFGRSAGFRNTEQSGCLLRKYDEPVFRPTCTKESWRITERHGSSSRYRNLLKVPIRVKTNPLAIGREERLDCPF